MAKKISRRDFIKWSGIGAVASVLTGCGPAARYVTRRPYAEMPEYNQTGLSTYYATTCQECPASCGIIVRTFEGRAIKVEGNPNHPVSRGKVCSRGLTSVQGLYNPDRVRRPRKNSQRGTGAYQEMDWDGAIGVVQESLPSNGGGDVVFLLGSQADHLYDFAVEFSRAAEMPAPIRYNIMALFDGLPALQEASERVFGKRNIPYFDLGNASVVFSFGADFLMSWLSPVAYSRMYGRFRNGPDGRRGKLVSFEPHLSLTSANSDSWLAIPPGMAGEVARAIGALVAEKKGTAAPGVFAGVDQASVAKSSGISEEDLRQLADLFANASQPLAIPGGVDPAADVIVLELNRLAGNLGQPGGVFLTDSDPSLNTAEDIQSLIQKMASGSVKTLFIHGVNPLFDLPAGWGFASALGKVPRVISFSPFEDETARGSDYIFPDHTALEAFGYQKDAAGADRPAWSSVQPVVSRLYDTRATVDLLLAAAANMGAGVSAALPYKDEIEFIQSKLTPLLEKSGSYAAVDMPSFWAQWLQHGGWWPAQPGLEAPPAQAAEEASADLPEHAPLGENQLHLIVARGNLGDGSGANRPWLQETPDPLTTAVWDSWVAINPETAGALGIKDDDVIKVESAAGAVEAPAYLFPTIRPDCVAIPYGHGHTAFGRYAAGRGCNPSALLGAGQNSSAASTFESVPVTLTLTGKTKKLARIESLEGVYGREPKP